MSDGQKKPGRRRRSKARKDFPKKVADFARQTAAVMVRKKMTTAHYIFDGAMGPATGMVLVTMDPEVVEVIQLALKAINANIQPADEVPEPGEKIGRIALENGVAVLAIDGLETGD